MVADKTIHTFCKYEKYFVSWMKRKESAGAKTASVSVGETVGQVGLCRSPSPPILHGFSHFCVVCTRRTKLHCDKNSPT